MESKLTILIPTLESRASYLNRLLEMITSQCYDFNSKIITNKDKGEKTIGEKRNALVDACQTEYCVFVDDDDMVAIDYVEKVHEGIEKGVDVISFIGLMENMKTRAKSKFVHRIGNKYEEKNGIYLRPPNHLNPMKTEHMRAVKFPHSSWGEDKDFCEKLAEEKLLKTEHFIEKVMYFYQYNPNKK